MISKLHHFFCVALGELMGGPDEEFSEPLNYMAVIIGYCLAILIVGLVVA